MASSNLSPPLVRLTRCVSFSSGHRYWISSLSEAENRALFGQWASPYNHGHNYLLEVEVVGVVDPVTGMVVNIKTIDDVLQAVIVARFDQKSINDEIEHFHSRSSSTENLMLYIASVLQGGVLPKGVRLTGLKLHETDTLFGEYVEKDGSWTMTLTRIYEFAAAHRLHVPGMTEAQNVEMFGKCNNEAGHGHNYTLEVTVEGEPDPKTGMMVDLAAMDRIVDDLVVERYDHKHLNIDMPEFHDRAPTSEVIATEIFRRLDGKLPAKLARVRLHETARSVFEVSRN
ncbi:MAG TPA: 6-carboxytetrahydropterin synthase [Fimbriimonadaceae bacterium]|nr:6-carboxytetrahydropterin synthase [Fimbriimonadaceae bacterium]